MTPRRFWTSLAVIAVIAFAVRLTWIELKDPAVVGIDGLVYQASARLLADGEPFLEPAAFELTGGELRSPGATHPPLYPLLLAVPHVLGFDTLYTGEVFSALLGVAGVVVIGAAARRIADARVGLVAAAIAALSPALWINDGMLMVESAMVPILAAILLAAYRLVDRPTPANAAVLGLLLGVGALTRAEVPLLAAALVAAVGWCLRSLGLRRVLALGGISIGIAVVVVAPWVGFNLARFERPTFITTSSGATLLGANCDQTYSGRLIGYWSYACVKDVAGGADNSVRDEIARREARAYAFDHVGRWPVVVTARLGRTFGFWDPVGTLRIEEVGEGRPFRVAAAALLGYAVTLGFAIAGAVLLRRRGRTLAPLLAVVVVTATTTVLFHGQQRFRSSTDVVLVILAAVALDAAWTRLRARAGSRDVAAAS